jgi:hypothetical protein
MMDPNRVCPYCSSPATACPHLLLAVEGPGQIFGGALAQRLTRLWEIIIGNVGDDPVTDPHGVYAQTWRDLIQRYALEGGVTVEGDRWAAIFVEHTARIGTVLEACIPLDEL